MGRAIHPSLFVSAWHVTGHTYNDGTRYGILSLWSKYFPPYYAYQTTQIHGAVLLEKSAIPQLDKKFPVFYDTRRSITAFTNSQPLVPNLSHVNPVQALQIDVYILILSSGLNLCLSSARFPSVFPTYTLYAPLLSSICVRNRTYQPEVLRLPSSSPYSTTDNILQSPCAVAQRRKLRKHRCTSVTKMHRTFSNFS